MRPHVHKDLMSNIIYLLNSIRVKINVNEMENGEERERGLLMKSLGQIWSDEVHSNYLSTEEG